MIKIIGKILKKIVFAFTIIYGVDLLLKSVGICIPLNIITVTLTALLGVPGLLSVFIISYIIK